MIIGLWIQHISTLNSQAAFDVLLERIMQVMRNQIQRVAV